MISESAIPKDVAACFMHITCYEQVVYKKKTSLLDDDNKTIIV